MTTARTRIDTTDSTTNPTLRALNARYDELLAAKHLDSTRTAVSQASERAHLRYEGRPICDVLRPSFLARSEYERLMEATRLVARALRLAARRVVADPALRASLGYAPQAEMAFYLDSTVESARIWARLDGFIGGDGQPRFVEYNSDTAGGLSRVDTLGEIFDALPIVEELRRDFDIRPIAIGHLPFDAFVRSHRRSGGEGLPRLAVLGEADIAQAVPDMWPLLQGLRARGMEMVLAPVSAAEWRDDSLMVDGLPVDVVGIAPPAFPEFMAKFAPPHPLMEALGRGTIRALNGAAFTAALFPKSILAMLSDPEHASLFDRETLDGLAASIPCTRVLREGKTTWSGEVVDLLPYVAARREQLVLKPNSELCGRGVVLGSACTAAEWEGHLAGALHGKVHVVQDRVDVPSWDVPKWRDEALTFDRVSWSADPYVWNDEIADGLYVRMSGGSTINIATGGSASAVMIVED